MSRNTSISFLSRVLLTLGIGTLAVTASESRADTPFKIGVIIPLSGHFAEYGVALQNGIDLARRENPERMASCDFLIRDSQDSAPASVSALRAVKDQGAQMAYVFGGLAAEGIAPAAERIHFPVLLDTIDPGASEGRTFVIRFAPSRDEIGRVLADHLVAQGKKRIAIVKAENRYVDDLIQGLRAGSNGRLTIEVIGSVPADAVDMRPLQDKAGESSFDSLGVFLLPGQIGSFLRGLTGHHSKVQVFGGDLFESPVEIDASNGALQGAAFAATNVTPSFKEKYLEAFSNIAQISTAAQGYDLAKIAAETLCNERAQLSPEEIVTKLTRAGSRASAHGGSTFKTGAAGDKSISAQVVIKKVGNEGQ